MYELYRARAFDTNSLQVSCEETGDRSLDTSDAVHSFPRYSRSTFCAIVIALAANAIFEATAWAEQVPVVSDYDEVSLDYAAAVDPILPLGREATSLVLANQPAELYGLFSPEYQQQLPLQQLSSLLSNFHARAPFGDLLEESSAAWLPVTRLYRAQYVWITALSQTVFIDFFFDENDEVFYMLIQGQPGWPPDPAAEYESNTQWRLPLIGVWLVLNGGTNQFQNRHRIPDQRHAYDLAIWKDGATFFGDPSQNESFWAFGQPILAPADGVAETVVDGVPDNVPGVLNPAAGAGNHIILRTEADEYVLLAHFQQDSILVLPGAEVQAGDVLGAAGNSGNSTEPHLHIHVQDLPDIGPEAIGLPLNFHGYEANGEFVESGPPSGSEFVGVPVREPVRVDIDIKPNNDLNPINLKSSGVIPVAILGSDSFDVLDVDFETLTFGPPEAMGAAPAHRMGGHYTDANGDGFTDLLSHYRTQATGITAEDIEACVTGGALDGTAFQSCDSILIVSF